MDIWDEVVKEYNDELNKLRLNVSGGQADSFAHYRQLVGLVQGIEWSRNKCCWPTGDPKKNGFLFCGEPVVPGKPYCLKHCYEAYTTSRDSN